MNWQTTHPLPETDYLVLYRVDDSGTHLRAPCWWLETKQQWLDEWGHRMGPNEVVAFCEIEPFKDL